MLPRKITSSLSIVTLMILQYLAMLQISCVCICSNDDVFLIIASYPHYCTDSEFDILRSILIRYASIIDTFDDYRIRTYISELGVLRFLSRRNYSLIIVLHFQASSAKCIHRLLIEHLRRGGSVLFVCQSEIVNSITSNLGFILRLRSPLSNVSTSLIANHTVTLNVWRIGVRSWCIMGHFEILTPSICGIVFSSPSWWKTEYPLVICGHIYNGRMAAIAPYVFSDDCYDNRILLENIIRWLLHLPIEPLTYNVPLSLKNLAMLRNKLVEEIKELKKLKEQLINETRMLEERKREYIKSLPEYQELLKLRKRINELEKQVMYLRNLKAKLNRAYEELRMTYIIAGVCSALCLIIGFIIGYRLWNTKIED